MVGLALALKGKRDAQLEWAGDASGLRERAARDRVVAVVVAGAPGLAGAAFTARNRQRDEPDETSHASFQASVLTYKGEITG